MTTAGTICVQPATVRSGPPGVDEIFDRNCGIRYGDTAKPEHRLSLSREVTTWP